MLICTCGQHNTPGDQICPGDCQPAQLQQLECAISGHADQTNLARNRAGLAREVGPVPPGEFCWICGEGER
jgi:hypothetical protein